MTASPFRWPIRLALGLSLAAIVWAGMVLWVARNNRALCAQPFGIASEAALIRQGVWNHLLSEAAADRALAHPGVTQPGFNPTDPIDQRRVDAFLRARPNCCRIYPYGAKGGFQYVVWRLAVPHLVVVFVNDPPPRGITRSTSYRVDACSANVQSMI